MSVDVPTTAGTMTDEKRKFDDVLLEVGEFGRYQIRIYNLICLFEFFAPWAFFVLMFLSGEPDHWCKIPEWDSVDCVAYGYNTTLECALAKREVGIPWKNITEDGKVVGRTYVSCERYDTMGTAFSPDLDLEGSKTIACNDGWEYDNTERGGVSINQEFDLMCGSKYQLSLAQSLFFLGTAIGSVVCGFTSDRIGRHRNLYLCLTLYVVLGVLQVFSINIWMFIAFRTLAGIPAIGVIQSPFVLGTEIVGPNKRNVAGNVLWIYFAVGYICLSVLAFFVRDWKHLLLAVSLMPASLYVLYIIIPESPRWLLSKGRVQESTKVMRKLAKVNGAEVKETFSMDDVTAKEEKNPDAERQGLKEFFQKPKLRLYGINLMLQLSVNTLVYYGISLSTASLGINEYLAFAMAGAVEVPACFVVIHPIEYLGRRCVYIFFMCLCGGAMVATIFIPPGIARACVAMIGKFAITSSFCIIYLHALEIFPTPVRNSILGLCTFWSNMSNILGPFVLLLSAVWGPFPLVIFTVLSFVGGALAYLLPETRGKKIPETMEEGENIGWKAAPRIKTRKIATGDHTSIKYQKAGVELGEHV